MHEIILPETKPALEWVNNRILQKVSPERKHALAQVEFAGALSAWARARGGGMAGTEWHFQIQPPGEIARTLVPDVAYLSYDRMPVGELEVTEIPRIAPDVVVEVRSTGNRQADIDEKVRVYLAAGTRVIFLVDPDRKIVEIVDPRGKRVLTSGSIEHEALPEFSLAISILFEMPRPRK